MAPKGRMSRDELLARLEACSKLELVPGIREEVRVLAEKMEERLRANEHKGHWAECSDEYLVRRAMGELSELSAAVANFREAADDPASDVRRVQEFARRVLHEAADVANFVMMLADNVGRVEGKIAGSRGEG